MIMKRIDIYYILNLDELCDCLIEMSYNKDLSLKNTGDFSNSIESFYYIDFFGKLPMKPFKHYTRSTVMGNICLIILLVIFLHAKAKSG